MTGAGTMSGWPAVAAGLAVLAGLAPAPAPAGQVFDEATLEFAARLELDGWERLAIQEAGRAKILDTVARRRLGFFYGAGSIDGASPTFSYLELYFNAGGYLDRPVIRLRDKRLVGRLKPHMTPAAAAILEQTGRTAPMDLLNARAAAMLVAYGRASQDQFDRQRLDSLTAVLHEAARADAQTYQVARRLLSRVEALLGVDALRIFPPAGGTDPWLTPDELAGVAAGHRPAAGFTATEAAELGTLFLELGAAWSRRDVERTNELSARLRDGLARRAGPAYPPPWRRGLERVHNRLLGFTIAWVGFFLAVVLLLASVAAPGRQRPFRRAGMAVFVLSTLFLLAGVVVRWIISGRGWHLPPLTNQYESVLAAALMAAVAGCVLELIFRKAALGLAGALFATAAMLCLFFQLGPLQGDINAPEALLNTSILAWHVAVLMVGYGVIGMSLVVSAAYLVIALGRARRGRLGGQAISAGADLSEVLPSTGGVLAELDRYNLILLQLACWMVAIGDVLGAYWADRAWGRWWGWDVKETWGLMTLLVYLAVIHLRYALPQRTRGVWTAALAIVGALVMGFTWWGVNYLLRGLHSYA